MDIRQTIKVESISKLLAPMENFVIGCLFDFLAKMQLHCPIESTLTIWNELNLGT